jgi:hypothetical protein
MSKRQRARTAGRTTPLYTTWHAEGRNVRGWTAHTRAQTKVSSAVASLRLNMRLGLAKMGKPSHHSPFPGLQVYHRRSIGIHGARSSPSHSSIIRQRRLISQQTRTFQWVMGLHDGWRRHFRCARPASISMNKWPADRPKDCSRHAAAQKVRQWSSTRAQFRVVRRDDVAGVVNSGCDMARVFALLLKARINARRVSAAWRSLLHACADNPPHVAAGR